MQHAKRTQTYNFHSPLNKPQITVASGEIFRVDTELATGDWLNSKEDTWSPEKTKALNPAVVVEIENSSHGARSYAPRRTQ